MNTLNKTMQIKYVLILNEENNEESDIPRTLLLFCTSYFAQQFLILFALSYFLCILKIYIVNTLKIRQYQYKKFNKKIKK